MLFYRVSYLWESEAVQLGSIALTLFGKKSNEHNYAFLLLFGLKAHSVTEYAVYAHSSRMPANYHKSYSAGFLPPLIGLKTSLPATAEHGWAQPIQHFHLMSCSLKYKLVYDYNLKLWLDPVIMIWPEADEMKRRHSSLEYVHVAVVAPADYNVERNAFIFIWEWGFICTDENEWTKLNFNSFSVPLGPTL